MLLAACGGGGGEPGYATFRADVLPVLEDRCLNGACHGVAPGAEERGEEIDWSYFFVRTDRRGLAADPRQAYQAARSRINTVERPELSTLLRKPLPEMYGGLPHWGGDDFVGPDEPEFAAVLGWIASETGGGEGASIDDLPPLARRFAQDVLPALATRQCLNRNCHGPTAPFTSFSPPMILDGEPVFPVEAVEKNYRTARHFLNLWGDAAESRLVRKVLPIGAGGIAHRGGNRLFFTGRDDPEVAAMLAWIAAERDAALAGADPRPRGFLFVRGPPSPAEAFDLQAFAPGTDVWLAEGDLGGGPPRNLTAAAHPDGPADARDPAVSHDGARVAFAMRRSAAEPHNLYELRVDGSGLRQLTFDADPRAANRHPVYGPDGRVYFSSTRALLAADGVELPDADIWAVDPETGEQERLTFTPSPEARPFWLPTGKSYGTLGFTVLRAARAGYRAAVFRMPLDHNRAYHGDPELHIHHGLTLPEPVPWAMRSLPDGRFATVLLAREARHEAGTLAIVERQFGPELPEGGEDEAAVPGFRHAVTRIGDGLWRDPAPLGDGSILGAHADADPARTRIVRLWIEEDPESGRPRVARVEPLTDPGKDGDREPEPILVRPPEDDLDHEPDWDASEPRAVIDYRNVETLEALFASLAVRGAKRIRDDLRAVRLVEALPVPAGERGRYTLGANAPARVLAEIPLDGGSFYCAVPPRTPLRAQFLGADGMAIGAQHDRWISLAPGEKFPGGVSPALYPTFCAGCHGALSGDPEDVVGPPDAITRASVTLATHRDRDPRRPRAPLDVAAARIEVDWRRDVRPLLERSCAGCHRGTDAPAGLDLSARPAAALDAVYRALIEGGWVEERRASARDSPLVRRIVAGGCPGDPPLSPAGIVTIARWIDLGAAWRGSVP